MEQSSTPLGLSIGPLNNDEKIVLTDQINKTIKQYKIILIFAYVSILVIVGIIAVPALYIAIHKEEKKLEAIQDSDLQVFEVKGMLSRKNVGTKGTLYAYMIDGQMIGGEVLGSNDRSNLSELLGKVVIFQYLPKISKNRLFKDTDGHGYNFILKTRIG